MSNLLKYIVLKNTYATGTTGMEHRNESEKTTSLNVINLSGKLPDCTCLLCYSKTMELNSCVGNEQWDRTGNVVVYA